MARVHDFVSLAPEGVDPAKVRTSNWNAPHILTGGTNGDLVTRSTGASDGEALIASVALGRVLASGGAGSAPTWVTRALLEGIVFPLTEPSSPADGTFWISATGTTPSRVISVKVRDLGITYTLLSVTV